MKLDAIPLSNLASVNSGGGAPQDVSAFTATGIPFVRAGSLPKLIDGKDESSLEHLEPEVAERYGLSLFPAGTVVFAKSGMSATKGHVYRLKTPAYVVNHLAALIPHAPEDSAFLVRILQRFAPTTLIKDAGYPSIRLGDIENMKVLAPDSNGRRRIAEILDKADALRAKRRAALAQLDTLIQAIFLDMFGDPATNPKGWTVSCIGEVADVQGGLQVTAKRKDLPRKIPYLRVANVYRGFLDLTEIKTIRATDAEIARTILVKDDLLIVEGHGNPAEIGRGALWDGSISDCIHQNHIIRARFDTAKVVPLYACKYLNSPGGRRHLLRAGKTTSGLNTISVSEVRGTPIALPSIELQREFSATVKPVTRLKTSHLASLTELDALFTSLQHRAFRGEL